MNALKQIYSSSLSLLTDLYELTMACGYWRLGIAEREAVFQLTFRKAPFASGYTVACGLAMAMDWLEQLRFDESDVNYLSTLLGNDGKPIFDSGFLRYLGEMRFTCDVDAIPEGTVVFPHEPMIRVTGPLLQAQIVETALLTIINFQTLIATKASRICQAAGGDDVLEFGLRRSQGIDGGISASRAASCGGCTATSNVLAGKLFDIPVRGTHAHSWVMSFDDELEAFDAYARVMPNNCVFLVDTYDTLAGVRHAVTIGKRLRERGHEMIGIRLDSGDLAYLSIGARKILDAGGFPKAKVLATNDLDEHLIADLKHQGATITVWGVGTRLVTAHDQPALGGVYKLAAIRDEHGQWQRRLKLSEQTAKISDPGILQVRRYHSSDRQFIADAIYDVSINALDDDGVTIINPTDPLRSKRVEPGTPYEDLLVPVFRKGQRAYDSPSVAVIRQRTHDQLARLHPTIRRFANPHEYPAGLERSLHEMKMRLVETTRENIHR